MAKTNWVLNQIVMPADMNQIGTEINAVTNNVNNFKFFSSFTQLGLTTTPTMQQVLTAMPDLSYLKVGINLLSNVGLGLPSNVEGTLEVSRIYTSRTFAEFNEFNGDKYTAKINSTSIFSGWNKLLNQGGPISGTQLTSTAPQGTAPIVVASTTKVENLNVGLFDGLNSSSFYKSATQLANGTDLNTILREGNFYTGSVAIASSIVNSPSPGSNFNLQVKMLGANLFHQIASVAYNTTTYDVYFRSITSASVSSWRKMLFEGLPVNGSQLISTATQGTAPLVVTSNTKVDNLNSDLVDGFHASQNKDINTVAVRRADGSIQLGGVSEFEQIGIKLPGRNRELRITQDDNNITYIQLANDTGVFIANPIQVNSDGTVGFNVSTNVIAYNNPNTPQVRNTHVGNTAPSNSLGINGDMYIEV